MLPVFLSRYFSLSQVSIGHAVSAVKFTSVNDESFLSVGTLTNSADIFLIIEFSAVCKENIIPRK